MSPSSSISNPGKQQKPSSCTPTPHPEMPGNWRGDGEDAGKGRFGEEMLSTPLPKLCDELLEPTYGRGGVVGRAWGDSVMSA